MRVPTHIAVIPSELGMVVAEALQNPSLRFVGPMVLPTPWDTVYPVTDYGGVHGNCHIDLIWVTSDLPMGKMRRRLLQH